MKLSEILKDIELQRTLGDLNCEISGLTYDSRNVMHGTLFVAIKGLTTDGHLFIKSALEKGAAAVLAEREPTGIVPPAGIPIIITKDTRKAVARAAVNYYRNPSSELSVIGITGTNGKTTTSYLIRSILENAGNKVGLLGTIFWSDGNKISEAEHTTPEAVDFQSLLREMADNGCTFAVTEVSSHSLALSRVSGTFFSTAVFTNLTQDHLDFHTDMEDYYKAKSMLFSGLSLHHTAVINSDDPYGSRLLETSKCRKYSYGLDSIADIRGENVSLTIDGIEFDLTTPTGNIHIKSNMVGIHNVYNILAAAGAALSNNIPLEKIASGISSVTSVPGRFERIDSGLGFSIVVDYAHTENALRLLIEAARQFSPKRIITVFGCGGDRDRGKRPLMGSTAVELSDFVIVTSDNPRSEQPDRIIREVESGILASIEKGSASAAGYVTIPDRKSAIIEAVRLAEQDDIVLIAGKGHEDYQIIGRQRLHFDDREEAMKAVSIRMSSGRFSNELKKQ
ncbi:MAG: UDP-N-acetylmuramoyl-L-alanyl-D-glutamate--2,6-diaminopimelate ligase [Nitrospirae bacterium]|nr:UDP-N-acetylmuramoyl-L-alanyl-D-glutamate--2,6-diaminopimelate ligase [Nitrospirota bacterium]